MGWYRKSPFFWLLPSRYIREGLTKAWISEQNPYIESGSGEVEAAK